MWDHYVYIHRKASNGIPFYVGKGKLDKRGKPARAYVSYKRNRAWMGTVARHGLVVEVMLSCQSDTEAQQQEVRLIAEIGRRDLRFGPLVNLTDGGDGHAGLIQSEETRMKRSINAMRERSPAWVSAIRAARKNGGNGGVVKRGDKLPAEWVANLAAAKLGEKNPYFGKPSPPSKKVRNVNTGAIYDSIARAALAEGVSIKALYQWLDGSRRNRSPLVRVSDGVLV